jgi:hypothetical protein
MTHPGGRPRKLTPAQERRVYETVTTTPRGRRCFVLARLAREFRVGVSTLERYLTEQRQREAFHVDHQSVQTLESPR